MTQKHFILVGRTSQAIASGILGAFRQGPELQITAPTNVIQAYFGKVGHENTFELFTNGKQPGHPIEQNLSEPEKEELEKALRGSHVTIVHSISGENTSGRALSLLDGVAFLKEECGVDTITIDAPHIPLMRNDRRFVKMIDGQRIDQRNAISSKNYARRLKQEGVDEVISFEAHSLDGIGYYNHYFGAENVYFHAMYDFAAKAFMKAHGPIVSNGDWKLACGAPDGLNKPNDLGIARAKLVGLALYANTQFGNYSPEDLLQNIPWMFGIHKARINSRQTEIVDFVGDVMRREAFLIDDIYASGGTTIQGATALKDRGAEEVTTYATHGVLENRAIDKLLETDAINRVILADTIPGAVENLRDSGLLTGSKFQIETVAPLIVADIKRVHEKRKLNWPIPVGP